MEHSWKRIFEMEYSNGEGTVIRWCSQCGAVAIDHEYDGRLIEEGNVRLPKGEKQC